MYAKDFPKSEVKKGFISKSKSFSFQSVDKIEGRFGDDATSKYGKYNKPNFIKKICLQMKIYYKKQKFIWIPSFFVQRIQLVSKSSVPLCGHFNVSILILLGILCIIYLLLSLIFIPTLSSLSSIFSYSTHNPSAMEELNFPNTGISDLFEPQIPNVPKIPHIPKESLSQSLASSGSHIFDSVESADKNYSAFLSRLSLMSRVSRNQLKVFVYNLPKQYNHQIAAAKPWCVKEAFGTEIHIHEALLQSPYLTQNPQEAHFFYVPIYPACVVYRNFGNFRAYRYIVKKALNHIIYSYPYWNNSRGRDHVWSFVHDFGGCLTWNDSSNGVFFPELRNSIFLSHLGDLNSACFETHKDIVIPPMCSDPNIYMFGKGGDFEPKANRTILAHFRGTINWYHRYSIPNLGIKQGYDSTYSKGVRQTLFKLYSNDTDYFAFKEGSSQSYVQELKSSTFCLCPRGYASWSRRLFDSIMLGCIPVIIADDIVLPFEHFLDYSKFAVKIRDQDVPKLKEILLGIPKRKIEEKQKEMLKVWKAFSWFNPHQQGDALDYVVEQLARKASAKLPVGSNDFY